MINVRKHVFETNSSSTHSIVVLSEGFKALEALYPEKYDAVKDLINSYYTKEEVFKSFTDIGATIDNQGTLDLRKVDPEHYDFGYRAETFYADSAHKILLVLAYLYEYEEDGWYVDEYFKRYTMDALEAYDIKRIIYPEEGIDRVNHQCHDELLDSIRYCLKDFMFRKDYILKLDHD